MYKFKDWIKTNNNFSELHKNFNYNEILKLKEDIDKMSFEFLKIISNPPIINFIEKTPDDIEWIKEKDSLNPSINIDGFTIEMINDIYNSFFLSESQNIFALKILEKNPEKNNSYCLSANKHPFAIDLLIKNPDKINWKILSLNPYAINILEQNPEKINWKTILINSAIFELDYEVMKQKNIALKEEIIQKTNHPSRIQKLLDMYIDIEDFDNYL